MLYSSSLALIMMLEVDPNERLMRGGAVMMRACGSAKRHPFFPLARIIAALPNACAWRGFRAIRERLSERLLPPPKACTHVRGAVLSEIIKASKDKPCMHCHVTMRKRITTSAQAHACVLAADHMYHGPQLVFHLQPLVFHLQPERYSMQCIPVTQCTTPAHAREDQAGRGLFWLRTWPTTSVWISGRM